MFYDQAEYDIRCEWGLRGVEALAPISDAVVIVDVLSFTTCVDIATSRGAVVFPYVYRDEPAEDFAREKNALLASHKRDNEAAYSLSPTSLMTIPTGTRLVLPSPNGSTLSLSTGITPTFAGCLRNAEAVAHAANQIGRRVAVIPAGERWRDVGFSLRPSLEDMLGAGAIIHFLRGEKSSEALAAESVFLWFRDDLLVTMQGCSSGKELLERGFAQDVELAATLNTSPATPRLADGAYRF